MTDAITTERLAQAIKSHRQLRAKQGKPMLTDSWYAAMYPVSAAELVAAKSLANDGSKIGPVIGGPDEGMTILRAALNLPPYSTLPSPRMPDNLSAYTTAGARPSSDPMSCYRTRPR